MVKLPEVEFGIQPKVTNDIQICQMLRSKMYSATMYPSGKADQAGSQ